MGLEKARGFTKSSSGSCRSPGWVPFFVFLAPYPPYHSGELPLVFVRLVLTLQPGPGAERCGPALGPGPDDDSSMIPRTGRGFHGISYTTGRSVRPCDWAGGSWRFRETRESGGGSSALDHILFPSCWDHVSLHHRDVWEGGHLLDGVKGGGSYGVFLGVLGSSCTCI